MKTEVKHIVVNKILLNYYMINADKKRGVVLFLHGWGSNSPLWFNSCASLAKKGFTLYFLDLPGFGKSQSTQNALTLDDYSYAVMEFMIKLGLKKTHIVGHSFGGKIGIKLTAESPELVKTLTLVDASGLPHPSASTDMKITLAKFAKPFFGPRFMHPLRDRLIRRFASEDYTAFPQLKQTFINIVNQDVKRELHLIKRPTLIIWGKDDANSYTPVTDAEMMHHTIMNSKLEIIDKAGHYCFLDQPTKFSSRLLSFLNDHE